MDDLPRLVIMHGEARAECFMAADDFRKRRVKSVDIDVSGFNGIRLNFVSQFGPVVLRYGGDISSPTEGTITVDLPMTALLDAEFFRNFALQLQRAVDDAGTTSSSGTQRETYRIRLQFRDSW